MTNLVNHAANRWVVYDINRVPDSTQTQSLHNKSLVFVEANGATHQRDGHARRRFIALSSSGHLWSAVCPNQLPVTIDCDAESSSISTPRSRETSSGSLSSSSPAKVARTTF